MFYPLDKRSRMLGLLAFSKINNLIHICGNIKLITTDTFIGENAKTANNKNQLYNIEGDREWQIDGRKVRGARCILCFIHKHKAPFYLCRNRLYTIHFSVVSSVGIQSFMEEANLSKDRVLSAWRGSQFSRDDYVK